MDFLNMIRKNRKAFTLTEILIVVVIIGIMAGLAIPRYIGQIEKGRVAEAVSILSAIRRGQVVYYNDHGGQYMDIPSEGGTTHTDINKWAQLGMQPPASKFWIFIAVGIPGINAGNAVAIREAESLPPGCTNCERSSIALTIDGVWKGNGPYAQGQPYAPQQ